ncbi:hypothetical protein SK355_14195 [Candidatus Fukatsuia symbiotica]|uniref:Uncharacterized protein n=1 Tax=Candidatus Fukatsuia symbiotica TaxID=1878942 RepID=A0A2U8I4Y4_9GAMM|nr:hypothetical protein [Candidatus Fukatsuia symbiotica]AWK14192.1 hypothetical protein CCS41_06370 [Candidatus Fukatsuia symbiotica]MEA9446296.1 hypothetical protein [Candidatus Fukatsuia symbiotica]
MGISVLSSGSLQQLTRCKNTFFSAMSAAFRGVRGSYDICNRTKQQNLNKSTVVGIKFKEIDPEVFIKHYLKTPEVEKQLSKLKNGEKEGELFNLLYDHHKTKSLTAYHNARLIIEEKIYWYPDNKKKEIRTIIPNILTLFEKDLFSKF